jgi:hypothetical protein
MEGEEVPEVKDLLLVLLNIFLNVKANIKEGRMTDRVATKINRVFELRRRTYSL